MAKIPENGKADDPSSEKMPQDEIGMRLRALYAEVESEAIPADLISLLEQLDAAEERDGK